MKVHAVIERNSPNSAEGKIVHIFTSADKTLPEWVDLDKHVGMDIANASLDAVSIGTKVLIDESGVILENNQK